MTKPCASPFRAAALAAAILSAGALRAACAPQLVQSACAFGGNNNTSNTASVEVPSGLPHGLLLVRVQADGNAVPPISVVYGGRGLKGLAPVTTSDHGYLQTWYLAAPGAGAADLVITCADGYKGHSWNVVAEVYSGVDQLQPLGAVAGGKTPKSAAWSHSLGTKSANSLVSDFLEVSSNPASCDPGPDQSPTADGQWCGGGTSANRGS
ncbi:MAG TPA: hypothetical protein VNZ67_11040, partial [bacterium]|nr:hypothetical protein [bacterium]